MINNEALVELAKYCARTCHVLKDVTRGRDTDSLNGPSDNVLEDLERYAHLAPFSPPTITSDIRIMRKIESMISERWNSVHGLREHHSDPTEECILAMRTELLEILRILSIHDSQFMEPMVSEPPQGGVVLGDAHAVGEIQQHVQRPISAEPSAPASMVVRYFFTSGYYSSLTTCPM